MKFSHSHLVDGFNTFSPDLGIFAHPISLILRMAPFSNQPCIDSVATIGERSEKVLVDSIVKERQNFSIVFLFLGVSNMKENRISHNITKWVFSWGKFNTHERA